MTQPKRNGPCSCGSGRKYKNCCGKVVRAPEMLKARMHRTDERLADEVMRWSERRYGRGVTEYAWRDFAVGLFDPTLMLDEDLPMAQLFLPWWIHAGRTSEEADLSPALEYLAEIGASENSFERRFATAAASSPFTFYKIAAVEQDRMMRLEDVLTGTVHEVRESSAAQEHFTGAYMFARVVTLDGVSVLIGSGPLAVEPSLFPRIKKLRDGLREPSGAVLTEQDLHDHAEGIRALYLTMVSQIRNPALPEMTNTDGDPIAPTRMVYDLDCTCEEAYDALWTLAEGHERADFLHDAERDGKGALRSIDFDWVREGPNPARPGWSNTILGAISIEEKTMEVHVNSRKRADRIKDEIEKRLGGKAKFRHAVVESVEKMMEEAEERRRAGIAPDPDSPEDEAFRNLPEVQEAMAKMVARHWETWFDEAIPALENLTPREAAKTAEGRELLEALLADYAMKSRARPGAPGNPDIDALRRELGLD